MIKTSVFSLIAILATSPLAHAESYFQDLNIEQARAGHIEVGLVRTEGSGVVEIYDYHLGEIGVLLGSVPVEAGANAHVHVNILRPTRDAMAVLRVGGEIKDMEEINFN